MKKLSLACMVLGSSAFLAACGGGGDSSPVFSAAIPVVTSNLAANADAAVVSTVGTTVVTFPTGFTGVDGSGNPVGVTGPTTVAFSGGGPSPTATITNGGSTATAVTTFGSCIFTFTTSTFPSSSPLGQGKKFTVNPCTLNVATAGKPANGGETEVSETFTFGTAVSNPFLKLIVLNRDGTITLGGTVIGKVTVTNVTGLSN